MIESAAKVIDLLTYIEAMERLKRKPTFSVPEEYFVAHRHELKNLPELQFNLQQDGDDIWLKLPRLKEVAPPEVDELLKPWVTVSKSPEKIPEIKQEITVADSGNQTRQEYLKDHQEVIAQFDWYLEYLWKPWSHNERPRRKSISFYNKLFALQQAISTDGTETPLEVVWGVGYAAWKKEDFATPVKHPLLLQACNVTLNEITFDLDIRPRDVDVCAD